MPIPDQNTLLNFRHFLEKYNLQEKLFTIVRGVLTDKGLMLKTGTIVDATIIEAPRSTKNTARKRDPEMKSTAKGNQWFFGMKAHSGSDSKSGLVHSYVCTFSLLWS